MSAFSVMARALSRELVNRGIDSLSVEECEIILRATVDAAKVADDLAAEIAPGFVAQRSSQSEPDAP